LAHRKSTCESGIRALIARFERSFSLPYRAEGSGVRPSRSGELFRIQLGDRLFALKLYEDGYFNDLYFYRTLANAGVPIPKLHAHDDAGELVGRPWILMDWLEGNQQISDLHAVGKQVGQTLRRIHTICVDGAGGRSATSWEFPDWHTLLEVQSNRDRLEIGRFLDDDVNKVRYLAVVDEFVRLGKLLPNQSFLLHGDLGIGNMIIDDDRLVAVIDAGWFVGGSPVMDVSYMMNSRLLGEHDAMCGFYEGYGVVGVPGNRELSVFRMYHWIGKLIHFSSTGQRGRFERTRQLLLDRDVGRVR